MEEKGWEWNAIKRVIENAKIYINDPDKLEDLLHEAYLKAGNLRIGNTRLSVLLEKIELFIQMIKAYLKGEYRDYPVRTLILIIAGLLYFINPFDIIPDFIPFTGYLDDLSIVIWIVSSIDKDIRAFEEFMKSRTINIDHLS